MNILNPADIEGLITRFLTEGPQSTHELYELLLLVRPSTKQGFYAALRKLKKEDVIVVYKKQVSLNTTWIRSMQDRLSVMSRAYLGSAELSGILDLGDRESVSLSFTSTHHLDAFWGHAQNVIIEATPAREPIYAYDPHYWFYIARRKTESQLLSDIARAKRQFLITVGGTSPLDRLIKRDFNSDELQYNIDRLFPGENYYASVIGDYVTEVWLDQKLADSVNELYSSVTRVDEEVIRRMDELLSMRARSKIRITRSKSRAQKLKRRLRRNFCVRK